MKQSRISVRVYYEDTDFSGVVYHANYLKFFERGRTEALRATGIGHADLLDGEQPLAFTARRMSIEFIKPARIDDLLEVVTTVREAKGARMIFDQEICCGDEVIVTAAVLVACITMQGKPTRLPKGLIEYLSDH